MRDWHGLAHTGIQRTLTICRGAPLLRHNHLTAREKNAVGFCLGELWARAHNHTIPEYPGVAALSTGGEFLLMPLQMSGHVRSRTGMLIFQTSSPNQLEQALDRGGIAAGQPVVLLDDIVASAATLVQAAGVLRKRGAEVTHALCVVATSETVIEETARSNITLMPVFLLDELQQLRHAA